MIGTGTDAALARILDAGRRRAAAIDAHHALLWEALCAATEGGKRFRPALVVATHDALGGDASEVAAEVGAAVELLHTAFVIHDDVIDDDHVRRGRPNVSGTFRALAGIDGADAEQAGEYGLTAAILAGDLALAAAVRTVALSAAPAEVVERLLDLFDTAMHRTASGELADVRHSLDLAPATLAQSLTMEAQKTSAYSFALPLQAGAVLAGAEEETISRLGHVGRVMGVAFQLADDLIGVFGDPARSGKSTTCDLRTRKQTPLLVHARTTSAWPQISGYLGRELTDDELDEVRALLVASGSRSFVEDLAQQHVDQAHAVLDGMGIPVDLIDGVPVRPAVLADDSEVAA
ncbi:geranylgeranyl diphosphate synthase type II [Nocardioides luteus]|uniref:Geranylgeranyl pyrophosphate synthase n=1 Tax=Nocardioides luteus TaxID=1844 RepID=A0ABQ5SS98_9ACTN|nr:polyprenyl synthetase family protein [Nocardioides luteus]MDR7311385.1 geranylgeranyl diphosphate synthase type II [Nocardioides luteus]GGR65541.1 geranylgeranyl pyrophosphate synthase [Nocardioides luteus]GLJ66890.1 geranylgeranyl pyrophosphate synthase [Nocardioides luteus]